MTTERAAMVRQREGELARLVVRGVVDASIFDDLRWRVWLIGHTHIFIWQPSDDTWRDYLGIRRGRTLSELVVRAQGLP